MNILKPVMTEKAVMMIESANVLTFLAPMKMEKEKIRQEIETLFNVKAKKIRTLIRNNKKYVYVKLGGDKLAIDVATELGLM